MNSPTYRYTHANYAKVIAGSKTQTRRVAIPNPPAEANVLLESFKKPGCFWAGKQTRFADRGFVHSAASTENVSIGRVWECPYGPVGTRKPIVTTWAVAKSFDAYPPSKITEAALTVLVPPGKIWWDDGTPKPAWAGKSRPAMFFPRHLYALAPQAECLAVKAERLQDISEEDVIAEGIHRISMVESHQTTVWFSTQTPLEQLKAPRGQGVESYDLAQECFADLWDSINATRGTGPLKGQYAWKQNPLVFATTFRVLPPSAL